MWKSLGCALLFFAFGAVVVWSAQYRDSPWYVDYAGFVGMVSAMASFVGVFYNLPRS